MWVISRIVRLIISWIEKARMELTISGNREDRDAAGRKSDPAVRLSYYHPDYILQLSYFQF